MARFEAVFFDLGNTLIYFDGSWPEVFAAADRQLLAALQSEGFELAEEEFLTEFRSRLNAYYEQRESEFIEYTTAYVLQNLLSEWDFPRLKEETMESVLEAMYAVSQNHWLPEADTLATLEALQAAGYRMAIISNAADDSDVQFLVDKAQIRPYFEIVLSSATCGVRKPNPRIFQNVLDDLGLSPEQAVMIGDTLGADILGARNAGMSSVWITRRADVPGNRDHLDTILPDASIKTLAELPELLADWPA